MLMTSFSRLASQDSDGDGTINGHQQQQQLHSQTRAQQSMVYKKPNQSFSSN